MTRVGGRGLVAGPRRAERRRYAVTCSACAILFFLGCGGSTSARSPAEQALVGTWLWVMVDSSGATYRESVTFNDDGSLDGIMKIDHCTGSASLSGQVWSATSATVTVTGIAGHVWGHADVPGQRRGDGGRRQVLRQVRLGLYHSLPRDRPVHAERRGANLDPPRVGVADAVRVDTPMSPSARRGVPRSASRPEDSTRTSSPLHAIRRRRGTSSRGVQPAGTPLCGVRARGRGQRIVSVGLHEIFPWCGPLGASIAARASHWPRCATSGARRAAGRCPAIGARCCRCSSCEPEWTESVPKEGRSSPSIPLTLFESSHSACARGSCHINLSTGACARGSRHIHPSTGSRARATCVVDLSPSRRARGSGAIDLCLSTPARGSWFIDLSAGIRARGGCDIDLSSGIRARGFRDIDLSSGIPARRCRVVDLSSIIQARGCCDVDLSPSIPARRCRGHRPLPQAFRPELPCDIDLVPERPSERLLVASTSPRASQREVAVKSTIRRAAVALRGVVARSQREPGRIVGRAVGSSEDASLTPQSTMASSDVPRASASRGSLVRRARRRRRRRRRRREPALAMP